MRGSFRRILAIVLMLGLGLFTAETLLAEVHDDHVGAAAAGSIESTAPHSHDAPDGSGGGSDHSIHVCHCAHSHAGPTASLPVLDGRVPGAHAGSLRDDRLPASAGRDLQIRPPIA